jgi:hypothetical protein
LAPFSICIWNVSLGEAFALKAPQMCVISDGPFSDTSSGVYSALATEAKVTRRATGLVVGRRALSRKDGHVAITVGQSSWTAEID